MPLVKFSYVSYFTLVRKFQRTADLFRRTFITVSVNANCAASASATDLQRSIQVFVVAIRTFHSAQIFNDISFAQ